MSSNFGFINKEPVLKTLETTYTGPVYILPSGERKAFPGQEFTSCELDSKTIKKFMELLPKGLWKVPYSQGLSGTDPEIFAFDEKGAVIPAWQWLANSKIDKDTYWDGVQAEFTTVPSHCHGWLVDSVYTRLLSLNQKLKQKYPNAHLETADVVQLPQDTLALAEDEYINLGCAPSTNAYEDIKPINIGNPREHPFRYSGTHLHYSVALPPGIKAPWFPNGTVVMMDKLCGLLLTALGRGLENPIRRQAYGRPGEYRVPGPTNFRLEYRTPGAFILGHPALFNLAADMGRAAYRLGLQVDGNDFPIDTDACKKIITECDADAAVKVIKKQESFFLDYFKRISPQGGSATGSIAGHLYDLLHVGVKGSGLFEGSVEDNWMLKSGGWILHSDHGNAKWTTKLNR